MFQQTFVSEAPSGRKPIGIAVSLIAQGLLLALFALTPLFTKPPLPTAQLRLLLLGPTPPVAPEKSIPTRSSAALQTSVPRVHSFRLTAYVAIPKQINTSLDAAPEAPDLGAGTGFVAGGDSLLSGLGGSPGDVPPPAPKEPPKVNRQTGPVAIGGNVAAANLIHRVEPLYPSLAKAARIQGIVIFQAMIGVDGQIRDLQLQEGHPLLVAAARNAILQWRYRPTLLNGKPVEVVTTITVRFALAP